MHGYLEMISEHPMESRVMKNKSILSVCIMVTLIGHQISLGTHTTLPLLEEASKFGKELAKDAMVLCIKSTIS